MIAARPTPGGSDLLAMLEHTLRGLRRRGMIFLISDFLGAPIEQDPDNRGFYYTRFPTPGKVPDEELFFHRKIYFL